MGTRSILVLVVIATLLLIDWFTFHDLLKGESYTVPQYLTGLVSLPLFAL